MDLQNKIQIASLFDVYGKLLTQKQYNSLKLIIDNDYGFSEIADILHVSRQNVYDNYLKTVNKLKKFEQTLKLVEKNKKIQIILNNLKEKNISIKEIEDQLNNL